MSRYVLCTVRLNINLFVVQKVMRDERVWQVCVKPKHAIIASQR